MIKLWHCHNARSLRVLWLLEELALDYQLECLHFPPRVEDKQIFDHNVLGTVPVFSDGDVRMTESVAICHYLVDRYPEKQLAVSVSENDYSRYLNYLYQSDATLTFPHALIIRYGLLEPAQRRQPQVVEDYTAWFLGRLRWLQNDLQSHKYLCQNRFTIADLCVVYALYLGDQIGLSEHYSTQVSEYMKRCTDRVAFARALATTSGTEFESRSVLRKAS